MTDATAPSTGGSLRQWAYTLLEEGQLEHLSGRLIETFLIVLIVSNVVAVALETIPYFAARFHALFAGFEEFSPSSTPWNMPCASGPRRRTRASPRAVPGGDA